MLVDLTAQDRPKTHQNHLFQFSREPLGRGLGASWGQDGPRSSPRPLPRQFFIDFGPQLDGFWTPTWWILDLTLVILWSNLEDFGSQLA